MKTLYSIILLFSLMVGVLQPVVPMIEYELYHGDLIEIVDTDICDSEHSGESFCCSIDKNCTNNANGENQELLDIDYYPLTLQTTNFPVPEVFPIKFTFHLVQIENIEGPSFLPNPPPPQQLI